MKRVGALLCALAAGPAGAGSWIDQAPVLSAVPVYSTSPACHPGAARRVSDSDLIEALLADLEQARCEAREISGWYVTYRYAGREYTRIVRERPGPSIDVEVEVHANAP